MMRSVFLLLGSAAMVATPATLSAQSAGRVLSPRYVQEAQQDHPKLVEEFGGAETGPVGSSRVDLQACKLEYSIVSPK